MKTATLIFALIAIISFAQAQPNGGLKGPAAKNYKPWLDKNKTERAIVTVKVDKLMGPAAKNQKAWERTDKSEKEQVVYTTRKVLKGPAAKNHKPWMD